MPSHSSERPGSRRLEIEPRTELAQRIAMGIVEVAIIATSRQAGKIELDAEMDWFARRQAFEQIGDLEVLAAGFEREAFGDLHWRSPTRPLRVSCSLHARRVAPEPGFVRRR